MTLNFIKYAADNGGRRKSLKVLAFVLSLLLLCPAFGGCGFSAASREPVSPPVIDGEEGYHVIVAGGEPEGVAAALSAARNGMRTLLVEEGDALGGLMTLGMLNFLDMNHGPRGELLTRGIFQEFYQDMGNAFDVEEAKAWFLEKCQAEPNLTVLLNTQILGPVMEGSSISGLKVKEAGAEGGTEEKIYRSLTVIDATVDADVAAAAGVPYTVGGEDYGQADTLQGVTLVFEVSGLDWKTVADYLKNDENPGTGADSVSAWGYGKEALSYASVDGNMRFRGPNIARQKNGNVLLNALLIFGVDALNEESKTEGIARGEAEIPYLIQFMRENFVGFEKVEYVSHAPRLYVRETRHIEGEYRLTITDVLENRDHWDRIGHGSYPVDVQATAPDNYGNVIGVPDIYSIPFRCLVPQKVDQLLVAGRSASYDSLPHGSARVIPVGMVTGEACGVAAAWSVNQEETFREMTKNEEAIRWVQDTLKKQGAYLVEYDPPRMAVMDHWAYPGVVVMRELCMTEGGYSNDYRLDEEVANRWALQNKLNRMMELINRRTQGAVPAVQVSVGHDEITVGDIYLAAAQAWSGSESKPGDESGPGPADVKAAEKLLTDQGVLTETIRRHCPDTAARATYGQLLSILGSLYEKIMETR